MPESEARGGTLPHVLAQLGRHVSCEEPVSIDSEGTADSLS